VSSGGYQYVSAAGSAVSTTVDSGGYEVVPGDEVVSDGFSVVSYTSEHLGGAIEVANLTYVSSGATASVTSGDMLVVSVGGHSYTQQLAGTYTDEHFMLTPDANGDTLATPATLACYRGGSRILTDRGEAAVEDLRVGDLVRTVLGGTTAPIVWIGHRDVDCARHAKPRQVWPVRVVAGAFGPGRSHAELFLSPNHAVYVNEVLIAIRHLVNDSTITQIPTDRVTYYHLELRQHDVVLVQGLPAESFLDMKDGSNYANRSGPFRLYPDFSARMWEAFGCARLIVTGPELAAARALVARFATEQEAARAGVQLHGSEARSARAAEIGVAWRRSNRVAVGRDCFPGSSPGTASLLTRNLDGARGAPGSGGVGDRLECYLESKPGELCDQVPGFGVRGAAIEVVCSEITMQSSRFQHVVDGGEDGSHDGTNGLLRAAAALQPVELGHVVAVLLAFGRPCALDEHGLQPGRTLAEARGFLLAGAFVPTGTQTGPGYQMPGGREAAHVASDLREDRRRRQGADARHGGQAEDQGAKGGLSVFDLLVQPFDPRVDFPIDVLDRRVHRIPLSKMKPEQKAVMLSQPPMQGIMEVLAGRLDAPAGQRRQLVGVAHASDHGFDHAPAAGAQNVADHRVQLDVGLFERLLNALNVPRCFTHQLLAGAHQRAQFLDVFLRNKTRPDQPARQQISDPHGVVHVRLAARNALDVRRIGHDQLEIAVAQDLPDRCPIDPGRLHRDMRAPALRQPRQQGNSPSVVVAKVRHSRVSLRPGISRTQATTVSLWTSRPATRLYMTCVLSPPHMHRRGGGLAQKEI
jgi:autotransporter passenger strand-loop-strand repeat protein